MVIDHKDIATIAYLGSVRAVLDESGNVLAEYDYKPFGQKISIADNGSRAKYIGKELDTESMLADHGVRKYDYATGRFTHVDKMWEKYAN